MKKIFFFTSLLVSIISFGQITTTNLEIHLPFSEDLTDNSGNGNNATAINSSFTFDRYNNDNSALTLNGTSNYVSIGPDDLNVTTQITLSAWVNTTDTKNQWIIGKYDAPSDAGYHLITLDGIPILAGRDGNNIYTRCDGTNTVNDGAWHHLVGVINDGVWELWIDGLKNNTVETGHSITNLSNTANLEVGRFDDGNNGYFNGQIDEVRLYSATLSDEEIVAIYNQGLELCYELDGDALDASGNDNHGTLNGGVISSDRENNMNSALTFNGSSDYISVGSDNLNVTTQITISAWVNTTDTKNQWIIGKYDAANDAGYHLVTVDGTPRLNGRDGNNIYTRCEGSITVNDGLWHHLVGVINDGVWELWIDGLKNNTVETGHIMTDLSNSSNLEVGRYYDGNTGYFNGQIDEVKLYSHALVSADILKLYGNGVLTSLNSIEEVNIQLYPNPTADNLLLNGDYQKFTTLEVRSLTGETVSSKSIDSSQIDISELNSGTYIILLTNKNGDTFSEKLVKL